MICSYKTILVLSPHTDDGELGAGGTIARFVSEGKDIYYVAFSGCETTMVNGMPKDTLRKECLRSITTLGLVPEKLNILNYEVRTFPQYRQQILDDLIRLKHLYNPDLVLMPSSSDVHQDHSTIHYEALRAFKRDASLWGYEHPWNNLSFTNDIFVKLELSQVETKIKALHEYKSQIEKSYMADRSLRALMCMRGSQIDVDYAEAFELTREIY